MDSSSAKDNTDFGSTSGENSTSALSPSMATSNQHFNIGPGGRLYVYNDSTINGQGAIQDTYETAQKISAIQLWEPVVNFSETQTYLEILNHVKDQSTLILHLHGVPGSGKTSIVQKLAQKFPYSEDNEVVCIKWHITCLDKGQDVKEQLKQLVKEIRKHSILPNTICQEEIQASIENDRAGPLVKALRACQVPVLLIIEDSFKNDEDYFVEDLLRSLKCSDVEGSCKFHLYLTTRSKSTVLSDSECSKIPHYREYTITGFSKEEGVQFVLNGNVNQSNEEECEAAAKIWERFSGSPLGLRAAKAYCRQKRINFGDYLEIIEKIGEKELLEDERKIYGANAPHVFQAITMPFQVTDQSNKEDVLIWKVLQCVSYFHHHLVPRFVFEMCCRQLRDRTAIKNAKLQNKLDSGTIITKLLDYGMCTESGDDVVVFHEVVLHAFRTASVDMDEFHSLQSAVWIMASLLTKDLRSSENFTRMYQLISHAQSLLQHVERADKESMQNEEPLLFEMVVSHLYSTIAAIAQGKSSLSCLCDDYFQKAVNKIWKEETTLYSLTDARRNGDASIEQIAEHVIKECKMAGDQLDSDFIKRYEAKIVHASLSENYFQFLKIKDRNKEQCEMAKKLFKNQDNDVKLVECLRECGAFLNDETHRKVFFADILASLLHSWSRIILYKDNFTKLDEERYLWFSSLSNAISVKCRERFGVHLLSELLSFTTGKIPIMIRIKSPPQALQKLISYCESALTNSDTSQQEDMYEQGLLKEVLPLSHPKSRMLMLRHLVRIYTRILNAEDVSNQNETVRWKEICSELYQMATDHASKLSNAPMWIVRCAKFYTAAKEFDLAIKCFDTYFEKMRLESQTTETFMWAVRCYGRTVFCGKQMHLRDDAIAHIQALLSSCSVYTESRKLTEVFNDLSNISSDS